MSEKRIVITGANGNLGGSLIKEIVENTDYGVVAVANSFETIMDMLKRERITDVDRVIPMNQDVFFRGDLEKLHICAAVHMAFSRANRPSRDIADSLEYAKKTFKRLYEMQIPKNIYISSQSVYGTMSDWRVEECLPAPETVYSMAKYAGEKLFEVQFCDKCNIKYSTMRLDYVIQSQKLVSSLCRDVKNTGVMNLKVGNQTFSYIDKSDVAKAIIALLQFEGDWKPIYNVGPHKMRYTLTEIADVVMTVAKRRGIHGVKINSEEKDITLWSGMDSTLFMTDTGWKPTMDIYQMVEEIYEKV